MNSVVENTAAVARERRSWKEVAASLPGVAAALLPKIACRDGRRVLPGRKEIAGGWPRNSERRPAIGRQCMALLPRCTEDGAAISGPGSPQASLVGWGSAGHSPE